MYFVLDVFQRCENHIEITCTVVSKFVKPGGVAQAQPVLVLTKFCPDSFASIILLSCYTTLGN